jgi:hypothetical protein
MRPMGTGFADRPVVPAVPRTREPMDRLADLGGRAIQDGSERSQP